MKEEKDNIKDVDSKLSTKNTQFSGRVLAAINEMCTTELCRPGIKLNEHINKLFPTEQSLAQLDGIMASLEQEVDDLDGELARLVEAFGEAGAVGTSALNAARESMNDLEKRLERVRSRTQMSDSSVLTMTRDINQLDTAKRNLTSSITTLHHLHILLSGVNSLNNWIAARRYADIASELPAVLNVLQLFDAYIHVEQVKNLTERVEKLKADLSMQLSADLKLVFQSGNINQNAIDMCKVTAVVGGKLEQDFQKWYVDQQFGEYIVLYSDSEDVAWVDKVDHRYRWYVTKLAEFERNGMGKVFPASWEMGRRMSMEFCLITRQALDRLMTRRRNELDWKLLAHAINHTIMFENLLCKRFPTKGEFNFEKIIWQVFNKYMDIFVEAQSKNLTEFLDGCANKIRTGEEKPVKDTSTHAFPLPSSADLFLLLKKIITETSKLCAEPDKLLKQLVLVFRQCLRGYAHGCLTAFLPQVTTQNSITTTSLLQNLIGEETIVRLTPDQQFFTCCILATADWCAETTQQLQEKLKQKIPEIDFSQEMELFYNISNTALNTLVQDVEAACDAALQMMTKINWAGIETVGDESGYISAIRTHLRQYVPLIRDYFSDRRKYFAHFCLKLATQLVNKFYGSILRCKPISISGAEQLLLDTHALKVFLLNMPSLESSIVTKPPTLFTTTVNKTMTKAEMVLKVVMTDVTKPDEFVINYSRMLPESDSSELQKILEMRSMRRSEQQQIVAIYRHKIEGIEPAPATSSMPSAFSAVVSLAADGIADSTNNSNNGSSKHSANRKLSNKNSTSFQLTKLPTRKRTVCFALNEEVVKYEAGEIVLSCHSSNSDMEQPAAKRRRVEIVPEEFLYGNIPPNEKKQQPKNNNTCTRVQRYFSISTNQQSHFQSAEAFILPQPMSVYQNVNSTFAFCIPFQFSSPFINQLGFGPPDQAFFQSNIQPPLQIMQQNDWANRNVFSSYRFQRTSSMRYNHYHKIHCRQSFTQKNVHTPSQHFRLYNTPPSNQMMKQNGMTYNNNNLVQRSPSNPAKQQTHRNPTQGFNPNFINGAKHTTFKFVPDPSKK